MPDSLIFSLSFDTFEKACEFITEEEIETTYSELLVREKDVKVYSHVKRQTTVLRHEEATRIKISFFKTSECDLFRRNVR